MVLIGLFGLWLGIMLAVLLWPIPDPGNKGPYDPAFVRAGHRFSRVMLGLFFASMIVVVIAKVYMEVLQAVREDTIPAGIERQAAPCNWRRGVR